MSAREGYPILLGAVGVALVTYAAALRMRSWPLWLLAFALTLAALAVAWYFREPVRTGMASIAHQLGA